MHNDTSISVKLANLIASDLGRPVKSGRWLKWTCPFHADGHTPSLTVKGEDDTYFHCFGCGKSGDSITWLREYRNLSYPEALAYLQGSCAPSPTRPVERPRTEPRPLPLDLQPAWREIIAVCEKQLWEDVGARARAYLSQRGLTEYTLHSPYYRLGYSTGQKIAGVYVPAGIVIPCFNVTPDLQIDTIDYVKVRRRDNKPKYQKLPGGGCDLRGLFGIRLSIISAEDVFLTEGEFDAMLLEQEAGDLVGVCTLGSASERFDFGRFGGRLLGAKHLFVAYDADTAGRKGAEYWQGLSSRIRLAHIPEGTHPKTEQPIKDITDLWQAGANLQDWVWQNLVDYGFEKGQSEAGAGLSQTPDPTTCLEELG